MRPGYFAGGAGLSAPRSWVTRMRPSETREGAQGDQGWFEIALKPAHGLGGVYTNSDQYEADLAQARPLGPEIVEWVTDQPGLAEAAQQAVAVCDLARSRSAFG